PLQHQHLAVPQHHAWSLGSLIGFGSRTVAAAVIGAAMFIGLAGCAPSKPAKTPATNPVVTLSATQIASASLSNPPPVFTVYATVAGLLEVKAGGRVFARVRAGNAKSGKVFTLENADGETVQSARILYAGPTSGRLMIFSGDVPLYDVELGFRPISG